MIKYCSGRTRSVFLIGGLAFKLPSLTSWSAFLTGLQGNMFEVSNKDTSSHYLAPILFHIPGGFLNVMPRCEVYKEELHEDLIKYFDALYDEDFSSVLNIVEIAEPRNFGKYKGRVVAIDYGHGGDYELNKWVISDRRDKDGSYPTTR